MKVRLVSGIVWPGKGILDVELSRVPCVGEYIALVSVVQSVRVVHVVHWQIGSGADIVAACEVAITVRSSGASHDS
jgi:hypothetical protein